MSDPDDTVARRAAIDVTSSFIVRAPAGSGKTTVLVQRVLALLAQARRPEEIVALTFTRKAAAEMRERVLCAMGRAARAESSATEPGRTTDALAARVLEQDRRQGWDLLRNPERIAIETIDAFNARLASHFAFESSGVGEFEVADDGRPLYRQAVARLVNEWGSEPDVSGWLDGLMLRFGNNLDLVESALTGLLSRREQWLPLLRPGLSDPLLLQELAQSFAEVGAELQAEVLRLIPASVGRDFLDLPQRLNTGNGAIEWSAIASFWLTDQSEWRKRFGRQQGVVSAEDKVLVKKTVAALASTPGLLDALALARHTDSQAFTEDDREHLANLRRLLVRLAGHLDVVFSEAGRADFSALAQGALRALGNIQGPSELLLALDYRIRHLLVDEFQDTSQDQFDLLLTLTAGWEPGDGRTVFLVGDPMQSIYGFRNAEVGLFVQAWQNGLPDVPLQPLTLVRNFRSEPALVEWVNDRFAPHGNRPLIDFVPCEAAATAAGGNVHAYLADTAAEELTSVVEVTRQQLAADPNQSIGILVRSRSHQSGLLRALAEKGIHAHGVEIDSLSERQTVQDLIGLTRAVLNLGDDIAWLACLRAPWCGLRLRTIEKLMALVESRPVGSVLLGEQALDVDEPEDAARLERLRRVMRDAMGSRSESGTSAWIEQTWRALGGEDACGSRASQGDAEQFFDRLDGLIDAEDFDPLSLNEVLSEPLGGSDTATESGVEVMTIHKAKGLEFDTVVLMGGGRPRGGGRDRSLLHWRQVFRREGSAVRLVAPASGNRSLNESGGAQLCRALEARSTAAEELRLLYVGLTRARHRLFLPVLAKGGKRPTRSSLIAPIWDGLVIGPSPGPDSSKSEATLATSDAVLERTACSVFENLPPPSGECPSRVQESVATIDRRAAAIGTVFHRLVDAAVAGGAGEAEALRRERIDNALAGLGLAGGELDESRREIVECYRSMLEDGRGQWLLSAHRSGASELPLVVLEGGTARNYAVDRTFVADGVRWVVDYKTAALPGGRTTEEYLKSQKARYWKQLQRYGLALEQIAPEPVRLALYFPRFGGWIEWSLSDPDPGNAQVS